MPQQMIWFFVSIVFSLIAWGIVAARYIWPELRLRSTGRSVAASAHPAQLPLHRVGILVPGVVSPDLPPAFAHSAAYGDIIAAILALVSLQLLPSAAGVAAAWIFNLWGFSRYPQRFLPGESRRTFGGAVGSRIFPSDCDSAAAADYARTRFPDSSATSTSNPQCKKAGTQHSRPKR